MGLEKANVARRIPADIAVVVFGTDRFKKRLASRFPASLAIKAHEAARLMGLRALRIVTDEQRQIAMKLPKGSLSSKGRTVVPLVKSALYDKLLAVAGPEGEPDKPVTPPAGAAAEAKGPTVANNKSDASAHWPKIIRGSIVLAVEREDEGWFPCVVQHVDGEILTLRWREWPDLPKFNRKATQVATLHPNAVKPC